MRLTGTEAYGADVHYMRHTQLIRTAHENDRELNKNMEIALTLGAVAIAAIIFFWLLGVVKTTLKTAFLVAFFLGGLWLAFGIGPTDVWEAIKGWLPDFLFAE
ncbi:MAG: hypothetical protein AB8B99_03295 [Phormidesmis sp.]